MTTLTSHTTPPNSGERPLITRLFDALKDIRPQAKLALAAFIYGCVDGYAGIYAAQHGYRGLNRASGAIDGAGAVYIATMRDDAKPILWAGLAGEVFGLSTAMFTNNVKTAAGAELAAIALAAIGVGWTHARQNRAPQNQLGL